MQFPRSRSEATSFLINAAAFVIVVMGMKAAGSILVPFLLAVFLAMISAPPFFELQRLGLPKVVALLVTLAGIIGIGFIFAGIIGSSLNDFTGKLDQYTSELNRKKDNLTQQVNNFIDALRFGSPKLSSDDITDWAALVDPLVQPSSRLGSYLKNNLSKTTAKLLETQSGAGQVSTPLQSALIVDLNKVIGGTNLFETRRFDGSELSDATRSLLQQDQNPVNYPRLNRLLLEDAFPQAIKVNERYRDYISNLTARGTSIDTVTNLVNELSGAQTNVNVLIQESGVPSGTNGIATVLQPEVPELIEPPDAFGLMTPRPQDPFQLNFEEWFKPDALFRVVASTLTGFGSVLKNTFLILLTVTFILLEVSSFPAKFKAIMGPSSESMELLGTFSTNIRRYLAIKTIVSLITGAAVAIWLMLLDQDYPLLWGLLAFLLNFVPTIGSIIAALPPVLLALIQGSVGSSLLVGLGYAVVNVGLGNIVEPRFMGRGLGLSPLIVFLSLVFWGWVLGPVGMLLSVLLTMTIKIALDSREETRWLAILLGPESGIKALPVPVKSKK